MRSGSRSGLHSGDLRGKGTGDVAKAKRNFILHEHFGNTLEDLRDDAAAGRLMVAVCRYAFRGETPDFSEFPPETRGMLGIVFTQYVRQHDADNPAYAERCDNNRRRGRPGAGRGAEAAEDGGEAEEAEEADTQGAHAAVPAPDAQAPEAGHAGARGRGFRPPAEEEVAAYCRERGNGLSAQAFLDHYRSNGWMVGRARMRDWQAAVRTWERNAIPVRAAPRREEPEEDVLVWTPDWREKLEARERQEAARARGMAGDTG